VGFVSVEYVRIIAHRRRHFIFAARPDKTHLFIAQLVCCSYVLMIELVQLALGRLDYEVCGASDGLQTLDLMRNTRLDLVLLDLMPPGLDGWQVTEAMQANPPAEASARHSGHRPSCQCLGRQAAPPPPDAYITKPFSLEEFRCAVQSVLGQTRKLAQAI
jgi:CheY-like chemotaxis protein